MTYVLRQQSMITLYQYPMSLPAIFYFQLVQHLSLVLWVLLTVLKQIRPAELWLIVSIVTVLQRCPRIRSRLQQDFTHFVGTGSVVKFCEKPDYVLFSAVAGVCLIFTNVIAKEKHW